MILECFGFEDAVAENLFIVMVIQAHWLWLIWMWNFEC